jgi:hypothetical protein
MENNKDLRVTRDEFLMFLSLLRLMLNEVQINESHLRFHLKFCSVTIPLFEFVCSKTSSAFISNKP